MTKLPTVSLIRYALLCIPILIFSCKDKTTPDFPYDKEYAVKPSTKTFEFSEIDTIEWKTQSTKKYNDLPMKKIQWDKLVSKRVEIGFPYAGSAELPEAAFYFDSLPSVDYFIDSIPKEKLEVRVVNLGEPEIEEAGPLTVQLVACNLLKKALVFRMTLHPPRLAVMVRFGLEGKVDISQNTIRVSFLFTDRIRESN